MPGLKEVEQSSPLLRCGLCRVTSFPRGQYEKVGARGNFTLEKPGKHYLNQVIKVRKSDKSR